MVKSFNQIKSMLAELLLISDASDIAVGGSLNQVWNSYIKTIKLLGFFSRTLNSHQQLYPMEEKEGLSLIIGTKKYDLWLSRRKFHIVVDNKALFHILSSRKGTSKTASHRLAR
uniref:RT_RNaseH domain-containing protein n=1 Tax=Strongyloides venezuelensis TaxID=75913 RepID=A0A0K0FJJ7_STRVS